MEIALTDEPFPSYRSVGVGGVGVGAGASFEPTGSYVRVSAGEPVRVALGPHEIDGGGERSGAVVAGPRGRRERRERRRGRGDRVVRTVRRSVPLRADPAVRPRS